MWIIFLNLIGGSKTILISCLIVGLGAAGWYLLHEHDARVLADANAAQVLAQAQADKAELTKAIAAVAKELTDATTRADQAEALRVENEKLPTTTACVNSKPIHNLVIRLQQSGRDDNAGSVTGRTMGLPTGTGGGRQQ